MTFRSIPWEQVAEAIQAQARIAPVADAIPTASGHERFNLLRRLYADPATRDPRGDPYFVDWTRVFTPIEMDAWCEIRCLGLPFLPQFPACGYFLDFADPEKRIALETDGKDWHERERDRVRDTALWQREGWRVYRVTGRECAAPHVCPAELREMCIEGSEFDRRRRLWLMDTVEGVCAAIHRMHYGGQKSICLREAEECLDAHRLADFPTVAEFE